ncbi:2785_t:CDS:2 [Entrophospora sp. SA101]|nr:2785_t:CDS:2 [Entrophospora sp. SA101]
MTHFMPVSAKTAAAVDGDDRSITSVDAKTAAAVDGDDRSITSVDGS